MFLANGLIKGTPHQKDFPELIQKPTRIVSFDETHLFLTGKENVGRKKMLVVKGDGRRNNKDLVVNKCSANLTQVGGSDGSGRALPQFNIVPALSLDPLITRGSVTSDFQDENGEYRPAVWTCNESGGMTDSMGPAYLDKVILPCFNPTCRGANKTYVRTKTYPSETNPNHQIV